jgi:glycyl-tRNA synthetase beta chain
VLRARFNDARFFWEADQKKKLAERVADLRQVTYQAKLGSYAAKTERNQDLAGKLAVEIGLPPALKVKVGRAAELAKCDLTTEMVKEFPELQGIIGGLYARHQGEDAEVADAIYDHYRPAGADDAIPRAVVGQMVALADKLDTLGGLFRLGMIPSGSRDPFALRRAAYGIIRILIEGGQRLTLDQLCRLAGADDNSDALREFFVDRLRYYLREVRGYQYDEVHAVLSASDQEPVDVAARAEAIAQVRPTPDFGPLAVSFKRIKNILRQAGGVDKYSRLSVDRARLEAGAESDLYSAFEELSPRVASLKEQGDYAAALAAIASLRPAVDKFFDKVLVMTQDEQIRDNRLAFLAHLLEEFSTIADFAEIVSA